MSTTKVPSPTSRLRFGWARVDITPPVGIYHRLWGAARHDRATGVHRPLTCDVLVFAPLSGDGKPLVRAQFDFAGLVKDQHEDLAQALGEVAGVPRENIILTHSHTHSSGWFVPDRIPFPGGEKINPYLQELRPRVQEACRQAMASLQEATITYATGRCNMAANRDYRDEANGIYACGYNPDAPADDTVLVARVTDSANRIIATMVNYACHGTTLAWENSLISPDFVGAMREEMERISGRPCTFLLGACGDLGPRDGFVGDLEVADKNGRQLAYAAMSALESMGPPATDFEYQGPVISGATLGTWAHVPFTKERQKETERFGGGLFTVDLPLKPHPDPAALRQELQDWEERQKEADSRGDVVAARDAGARAERARRWLGRIQDLPEGETYPFPYSVHRLGDAIWVTTGGEPYSVAQTETRRRFPDETVLFSPCGGALQVAYLLPTDRYGKGLYQEEPSILARGCLETLIDTIAGRIEELR